MAPNEGPHGHEKLIKPSDLVHGLEVSGNLRAAPCLGIRKDLFEIASRKTKYYEKKVSEFSVGCRSGEGRVVLRIPLPPRSW